MVTAGYKTGHSTHFQGVRLYEISVFKPRFRVDRGLRRCSGYAFNYVFIVFGTKVKSILRKYHVAHEIGNQITRETFRKCIFSVTLGGFLEYCDQLYDVAKKRVPVRSGYFETTLPKIDNDVNDIFIGKRR